MAINKNANAPIFKNCDYGIVGDVMEILPLLTRPPWITGKPKTAGAGPMVKMKRPLPRRSRHRLERVIPAAAAVMNTIRLIGDADSGVSLRGPYLKSCRKTGFARNVREG